MNNKISNKKYNKNKSFKSKPVKNKYSNIIKIKNGLKTEINGWKCITIKGAPHARGYAHGELVKKELEEIYAMLKFSLYEDYGRPIETFIEISNDFFTPQIKTNFPEFLNLFQTLQIEVK